MLIDLAYYPRQGGGGWLLSLTSLHPQLLGWVFKLNFATEISFPCVSCIDARELMSPG